MLVIGLMIGVAMGGLVLGVLLVGERGRLLLPSSRRMLRELGGRRIFSLQALHAYVYGRWTAQYVSSFLNYVPGLYRVMLTKLLPDRYHAKILTHDHATAIIASNKDIPLCDLEQVIPYPKARKLVLQAPPEVAVYECPCRHARAEHCEPTEVCMVIGQPFVDFILEHHPRTSRKITQAEALDVLAAEHARGHVHTAWFKEDCLGRFYAICNCCTCCCGGLELMRTSGAPLFASSGYVSLAEEVNCKACGRCAESCPFGALALAGERVARDWQKCMGCGVCTGQCPQQVFSLIEDRNKGVPFEVRLLG